MFQIGVRVEEDENLIAVGEILELDQLADKIVLEDCLERGRFFLFSYDLIVTIGENLVSGNAAVGFAASLIQDNSLEDVLTQDELQVNVTNFIIVGIQHLTVVVLNGIADPAELNLAATGVVLILITILSDIQIFAVDVEDLSEFVVVVGTGTANLEVDSTGFILKVEFAVNVSAFIGRDDLSPDNQRFLNKLRLTVFLVQGLQRLD